MHHLGQFLSSTARGASALPVLLGFACADPSAPLRQSSDQASVIHPESLMSSGVAPPLHVPLRLGPAPGRAADPQWHAQGLWPAPPARLYGLAKAERCGPPTYDPSSAAWYASANGSLVRVEPDGRLVRVLDDVQGGDVDVRAAAGLAVSREPGDAIVLRGLGEGARTARVLLRGPSFFHPRFSPDGSAVLVAESRADGGHVWVAPVDGEARDLGPGYGATWLAGGRHVLLSVVEHDGRAVVGSDLWVAHVAGGGRWRLAETPLAEVEPAVSPDGRMVAFLDARSGELYVAALPPSVGGAP
jgi:hypothetical protein